MMHESIGNNVEKWGD